MAVAASSAEKVRASEGTRWGQLVFGIICMVMIANLQYGWTLFVGPIDQKYHWGRAAIQVAFTIFVLTETWLVPIEGYLIDKFVHGERHSRAPSAPGQRADVGHRQLARRVLCSGGLEYHRCGNGFGAAQTHAHEVHFEKLSAPNGLCRPRARPADGFSS